MLKLFRLIKNSFSKRQADNLILIYADKVLPKYEAKLTRYKNGDIQYNEEAIYEMYQDLSIISKKLFELHCRKPFNRIVAEAWIKAWNMYRQIADYIIKQAYLEVELIRKS